MRTSVFSGIAAAFLMLTACSVEISENASLQRTFDTFSADIEGDGTKVSVSSSGLVHWRVGDKIGVFGDDREPVCFTYGEDGHFHGDPVTGHSFTAFYPWDIFKLEGNALVLKDGYPISPFDEWVPPTGILMTARSTGNQLTFRQTCGIIHFHITGSGTWTSAALSGNHKEGLSTGGSIDLSEDIPYLTPGILFNHTMWHVGKWNASEGFDLFFPLAPRILDRGFSLTLYGQDKEHVNATSKKVTIERGRMLSYSIDTDAPDCPYVHDDAAEREALIAFYNAMDGPNWKNNDNWCSDKPLREWFGVNVGNTGIGGMSEMDDVVSLWMEDNGLKGTVPAELSGLKNLRFLCIFESEGGIDYSGINDLPALEFLRIGLGYLYYPANDDPEKLSTIPERINTLPNLKDFEIWGFKGPVPDNLFKMDHLKSLRMERAYMDDSLPEGFSRMSSLESLIISGRPSPGHQISGPIPDDLWDCTSLTDLQLIDMQLSGPISPKVKNLVNLKRLRLCGNKLSGPLPKELTELDLDWCELMRNDFSGEIPAEFDSWPTWQLWWSYITEDTKLDFSDHMPYIPEFKVSTIDGGTFSSHSVTDNKLTVLYSWASWCPFSPDFIPKLKTLYADYKEMGLEVVSYSYEEEDIIRSYASRYEMPWPTFANVFSNGKYPLGIQMYPSSSIPGLLVYNQHGRLIFYSIGISEDFVPFVRGCFGDGPDLSYESSDYSSDGTVHVLQTASKGAGIDVILMGDAFTDRHIADGTYAAAMERACEAFFVEEPFKSFRNCFNVSYVDVVSRNGYHNGSTALKTWYGEGTEVGGDDATVFGYADKILKPAGKTKDDALVIVLMNRDYHAGTCYMQSLHAGDYGRGASIAYVPTDSVDETFGKTIRHEAGGHGFAKLADEYGYMDNGKIPNEEVTGYKQSEPYGWWRNIDFTADPDAVKWRAFLSDERYSVYQQMGTYEGGATYWYGVWRPTPDSIMNTGNEGFNAPSRYAIWYRIGKLANGESWNGSFEDFLSYDTINITTPEWARSPRSLASLRSPKPWAHTPPVVVEYWK